MQIFSGWSTAEQTVALSALAALVALLLYLWWRATHPLTGGGYVPIVSVDPPGDPSVDPFTGSSKFENPGPSGDSDRMAIAIVKAGIYAQGPSTIAATLDGNASDPSNQPDGAMDVTIVTGRTGQSVQDWKCPSSGLTSGAKYQMVLTVTAVNDAGGYVVQHCYSKEFTK